MGQYGHKFDSLIESRNIEVIKEQEQFLLEMHISKKDLQDPDILKKVLANTKKEADVQRSIFEICGLLGICCDIVVGIAAGSIMLSLSLFLPFIIGSLALGLKITKGEGEIEEANIKKLVAKTKELKTKTEKLKDSKEKKRILDNCEKILASVDKYKKDQEEFLNSKKSEKMRREIENVISYSKGEDYPSDNIDSIYVDFLIGQAIGISTNKLDSGIKTACKKDKGDNDTFLNYICGYNDYYKAFQELPHNRKELEAMSKKTAGFKDNSEIIALYAIDDTIIFFNFADNKFYYSDYFAEDTYSYNSLFDLCKHIIRHPESYDLSEKDIELYKEIYKSMK